MGYFQVIARRRRYLPSLPLIFPIGGVWARGKPFIDYTVFGRQTDFQAQVEKERPEAQQPLAIQEILDLMAARRYSRISEDLLKEKDRVVK